MTENLKNLEIVAAGLLASETNPSPSKIREIIGMFRQLEEFTVDDASAEKLAREFEVRHAVTMKLGAVLSVEYQPWLDGARAGISPFYWKRYRQLLVEKGFSGQVIATLDSVTDRILGLLENPAKAGSWDRRGLVMGHVQSGKTANYIGLICKAADAGYKLIVVIAGIHNNLRNQTQIRIDEGFVGYPSDRLLSKKKDVRVIGVGRFDQARRPITFTNAIRDFNRVVATGVGIPLQNLSEPAIFVIKKNSTTLKNLLQWLNEHSAKHGGMVDTPMLLIDDEADNASINLKHGKDEVSKINGQIRELLKMFERSCYVGYTATPFANIFIDPDSDDKMIGEDLFPRSFIVSLDSPTNYFGARRVFIDDSENIIRYIDDNEDRLPIKHHIDFQIEALPQSMIQAIRTFVIARAIRLARGQDCAHCSMLVNASRFTAVQGQITNEIHNKLQAIQASVRLYGALPMEQALRDSEILALHSVWLEEFSEKAGFDWPTIQNYLNAAAAPIKAVEINSKSTGSLNYKDYDGTGLNIIAVGGFSLSRGLTLEGLMVSYFLRNSMMYDTLMQMGRWFGYRPNYDDLCRVWMPEEAEGWYSHITESIEMLREELRIMEAANATPEDFGLKVRSHPDTLVVTARNKMGSSEKIVVNIGLANNFIETAILKRDHASLKNNRNATLRLVERLAECAKPTAGASSVSGGWLLRNAPVKPVLDYISEFQNHTGSLLTDPGPVSRFIEERCKSELSEWDILFASLRESANTIVDNSIGLKINCQTRTAGRKSDGATLCITNKQRVASRGVEKTGLSEEIIADVEARYRREEGKAKGDGEKINYPDRIYRAERKYPLLIIHLLKIQPEQGRPEQIEPIVAWSISFPKTKFEEKRVEYVVNTTWLRENYKEDIEEEEMGGDDE